MGAKKGDVLKEEQSYRPRNTRQWDELWTEDASLESAFCSYYFCFYTSFTIHVPTQTENATLTQKMQAMPQVTRAHFLCTTYHRAEPRKT